MPPLPPNPPHENPSPLSAPSHLSELADLVLPAGVIEASFAIDPVEYAARFLRAVEAPGAPWTGTWSGNSFALQRRGFVFFQVVGHLVSKQGAVNLHARLRFSPKAWVWWLLVVHAVFIVLVLLLMMGGQHYYEALGILGFVVIYTWMIRVLLLDDLEKTQQAASNELRFIGEY